MRTLEREPQRKVLCERLVLEIVVERMVRLRLLRGLWMVLLLAVSRPAAAFVADFRVIARTNAHAMTTTAKQTPAKTLGRCSIILDARRPRREDDFGFGDDLPLTQYQKVYHTLASTLDEVRVLCQDAQSLTRILQAIEGLDSDLQSGGPQLSYTAFDDASETEGAATTSHRWKNTPFVMAISDPLVRAVEYAVSCSDRIGRYSHAATNAWQQVDSLVEQEREREQRNRSFNQRNHPTTLDSSLALLSHPSYRYSYATNVLLRQEQVSSSRQVGSKPAPLTVSSSQSLQTGVQEMLQSIHHLQDVVLREQGRLDDVERDRSLRIRQWRML